MIILLMGAPSGQQFTRAKVPLVRKCRGQPSPSPASALTTESSARIWSKDLRSASGSSTP
ncbi:hypothetical protein [Rhizobium viscosum]|uniref:Uncharacterized protein n=1 Tax=Rhizobium viscosum TaxID=1673 RepID=A0ABR9IUD3_RHIVS|nr:hypothetical protein [Rhizobium viscosum]MBE1506802.1 hypothetical protein [Rhizobium viscosum]